MGHGSQNRADTAARWGIELHDNPDYILEPSGSRRPFAPELESSRAVRSVAILTPHNLSPLAMELRHGIQKELKVLDVPALVFSPSAGVSTLAESCDAVVTIQQPLNRHLSWSRVVSVGVPDPFADVHVPLDNQGSAERFATTIPWGAYKRVRIIASTRDSEVEHAFLGRFLGCDLARNIPTSRLSLADVIKGQLGESSEEEGGRALYVIASPGIEREVIRAFLNDCYLDLSDLVSVCPHPLGMDRLLASPVVEPAQVLIEVMAGIFGAQISTLA